MPANKRVPTCIVYDGRGANASGIHTPKEFLAAMAKDKMTKDMCKAASANRKLRLKTTDAKGKIIQFSVPPCPAPTDVRGWMKWSGARACKPANKKR
jgi:hypothetical protein